MDLERWPAQFVNLCGGDAAPLALVAVNLQTLLPPFTPLAREVVAARCAHACWLVVVGLCQEWRHPTRMLLMPMIPRSDHGGRGKSSDRRSGVAGRSTAPACKARESHGQFARRVPAGGGASELAPSGRDHRLSQPPFFRSTTAGSTGAACCASSWSHIVARL